MNAEPTARGERKFLCDKQVNEMEMCLACVASAIFLSPSSYTLYLFNIHTVLYIVGTGRTKYFEIRKCTTFSRERFFSIIKEYKEDSGDEWDIDEWDIDE